MDRRKFLTQSLYLGGGLLLGACPSSQTPVKDAVQKSGNKSLKGGRIAHTFGFLDDGDAPMETVLGEGFAGRRFTDLGKIGLEGAVTSNDRFFVRTRAPQGLSARFPWKIKFGGLVKNPLALSLAGLEKHAVPQAASVLECAGNDPGGKFGMLSMAEWDGIPVSKVLELAQARTKPRSQAARIRITGMDDPDSDGSSVPGASWIFHPQDLEAAGAFLATRMNGQPLSPDNGHPVRLMVPGWYGCCCIKWVDTVDWVGEDEPATSQMMEYADRTHQLGVPESAKDYRPARMGASAMPVRVEKWLVEGSLLYKLIGLSWGGDVIDEPLQIKVGNAPWEDVVPESKRTTPLGWSVWSHVVLPEKPGKFAVNLRTKNPAHMSIRLERGFYTRTFSVLQ